MFGLPMGTFVVVVIVAIFFLNWIKVLNEYERGVFFRVVQPIKAVVEVENFLYATSQLAQTTLRSVLGQVELDDLLAERERLNMRLQDILDKHTDPWGIKVTSVEVKHVDLPPEMPRAIAKQAE